MMHSPPSLPSGSSSNAAIIRPIFVRRVYQLIQLGYNRLTPSQHVEEQEPAITGFLVEKIDQVLSERAASWMGRFSVHDDPPENAGNRKGKKRKRVDLRIDSGHYSPRARYRFEAKRLGKGNSIKKYLGIEGLGCFTSGDYAHEEDEAGMLGYVQSGNPEDWAAKIGGAFSQSPIEFDVDPSFPFSLHSFPATKSLLQYRSRHRRPTIGRPIFIVHTMLKFHE
jgi:hypothetical protein